MRTLKYRRGDCGVCIFAIWEGCRGGGRAFRGGLRKKVGENGGAARCGRGNLWIGGWAAGSRSLNL